MTDGDKTKKPSVDPTVPFRLFLETENPASLRYECSKAPGGRTEVTVASTFCRL